MKTIYVISAFAMFIFGSCNSAENKKPGVAHEHRTDSFPADNTSVADSVNGNANVGMGGSN